MVIFLFLLLLLLIHIVRKSNMDIIPSVVIYSFIIYWFGCLISCTFEPFKILTVSTKTYITLTAGVVSLFSGLYISCKKIKKNSTQLDRHDLNHALTAITSSNKVLILYIPIVLYCVKFAIAAVAFSAINGGADVSEQNENIFLGNDNAQLLVGYVITPLFHVSLVLLSYCILNIRKLGIKCLLQIITYLALLVEFLFISGSKSMILTVAIYFCITYLSVTSATKLTNINFKKIIYLASGAIAVLAIIAIMWNYRDTGELNIRAENKSENDFSPVELIGRYSVLPIVMFDQAMITGRAEKYGRCYGRATLGGLDSWVSIFLGKLGLNRQSSGKIVEDLEEDYFAYTKDGYSANYAYTAFFFNYIDFGVLGILFWPFVLGIIYGRLINRFLKKPNLSGLLVVAICYFILVHSVFTCYLIKGWVILYIIILLFVNKYTKWSIIKK